VVLRVSSHFIAPVLSGALLVLTFPPYDLGWLAWVGLVPLFYVISGVSPAYAFLLTFAGGVTFFAGVFNWVFEVSGYRFIHHVILGIYLGTLSGFFGLTFGFISKRRGVTSALFAAPFVWVSLEYARSNMGFMGFPYGWLGYSQHPYPLITQIASITGAYGISFLIATVNAAIAAAILLFVNGSKEPRPFSHASISRHGVFVMGVAACILTCASLFYGLITVSEPLVGNGIKVSVVQGSIEQEKKWDPKYHNFIMQTYVELTKRTLQDRPALIVWPEASTPKAISLDKRLRAQVKRAAETAGTYLLVGSSSHQKFKAGEGQATKFRNSAFLISPEIGAKSQQYDKIHLLPFGEYLPYRETIPWSWIDVPRIGAILPGTEFIVFRCPTFRFSAPICWENIFPQLPRKFVQNGAEFLVNITNEAWFGRSVGPQHYVISSIFRAVENGVYVVRCANTGISCFIDPYGRVVGQVQNERGEGLFVRGVLTETVIPMESNTFYTRYGDWLIWLSFTVLVFFVVFAFLKPKSTLTRSPKRLSSLANTRKI
jgi:apolipoprotein N-acyltransferase